MDKKTTKVIIIVAIALFVIGYFILSHPFSSKKIVNGWYNEETNECWIDESHPPGTTFPADEVATFGSCCFDLEGYQVDCNNPKIRLGPQKTLAIYSYPGATGVPGVFAVGHVIGATNTGNVDLDSIWIDSATWTPSSSELSNAYSVVIGQVNEVSNLAVGQATSWSTGIIDLQSIGGTSGNPKTYTLDLIMKATAGQGQLSSSRSLQNQITIEQEDIGFSISMSWM